MKEKKDKTDSINKNVQYFCDIKGGGDLEHLADLEIYEKETESETSMKSENF